MKTIVLILVSLWSYVLYGQKSSYNEADFPKEKYLVKKEKRILGNISIEITHAKPQDDPKLPDCITWLKITDDNKIIKYSSEGILAVGGCSGFYFPEEQPNSNLILISKFGDYNGRLYIITKKGEVKDFAGGAFFISSDKKYLFSNYDSDSPGITIIDLEKNILVASKDLDKFTGSWYYLNGKYFTTLQEGNDEPRIKLTFDISTKQFIEEPLKNPIDNKYRLKLYNSQKGKNCNCGE